MKVLRKEVDMEEIKRKKLAKKKAAYIKNKRKQKELEKGV